MKWYENWIQVFKIGEHTDSAGNSRTWTQEDLDTIVANYDPTEQEAPVVLGHPKTDEPAYAWVSELRTQDGILYAKFTRVDPEFSLWVEKGLYRKISIALDADLNLRHVGFLGAANPAVKGLCNDFSAGLAMTDIVQEIATFSVPFGTSENNMKGFNMFKKQSTQEFAQRVDELERELEFAQKAQARQEFASFLGTLHSQAKITAEDKIHLAQVFETLFDVDANCFSQNQEGTSVAAFSAFLQALPSRAELKELATRENSPKGTYRTPQEELGMKIAKSIRG